MEPSCYEKCTKKVITQPVPYENDIDVSDESDIYLPESIHLLFFDNWFSSSSLLNILAAYEVFALRTIRAKRLKGSRLLDDKTVKTWTCLIWRTIWDSWSKSAQVGWYLVFHLHPRMQVLNIVVWWSDGAKTRSSMFRFPGYSALLNTTSSRVVQTYWTA